MHEFAQRFADAWAHPTPDGLVALLHDDVVLRQPHLPPIRGKAAAHREMRRLLHWLPELHGIVDRASGDDQVLYIEWRMKRSRSSHDTIPAVDRFFLRDGLGAERVVYFDQLRLIRQVLAHPGLWPGYVRYRYGADPA